MTIHRLDNDDRSPLVSEHGDSDGSRSTCTRCDEDDIDDDTSTRTSTTMTWRADTRNDNANDADKEVGRAETRPARAQAGTCTYRPPSFILHELGASPRAAGKAYSTQGHQVEADDTDTSLCAPSSEHFRECVVVFSGLDADVARDIEAAFRGADFAVYSNAKWYRRDPTTRPARPPYPSHLFIIPQQRSLHTPLRKNFIVNNANCWTTSAVIPLAALERAFGAGKSCLITTMQAISGAGYPGVPSLDILDNIVPYIPGEEEKMQWETLKISRCAGTPLRDC
ncbi:hypothetical protein FA95DRAFT_1613177 [Auriscalpium vulgare]|uniref:Uncharacterized protein n=1 Tax=Auriscalpium vulgare TaxID=40419 RepID=A0ACB8R494_9AGAM|nr:hypothetical protein FA95DRAFT_1613177 [Auriscalpium vulgare]